MVGSPPAFLWNGSERRPRAFWRVVAGSVLVGVVAVGVGTLLVTLGVASLIVNLLGNVAGERASGLFGTLVSGVSIVVGVGVAGWYVDRRHLSDFGFHVDRSWWVDLGFGLGLGLGLMTLVFVVGVAADWFRVTGVLVGDSLLSGIAFLVVLFLLVGVYEELFARGYLLTNVAEGLVGYVGERVAVAVAVLVSSAAFGLFHATNPASSTVSVLTISLAGVMLALGYVLTNDLAIPIGLHVTWNLFQGGVYGFPVSGLGVRASVVRTQERGPDVVTGGSFGPEAGLLGVGAILLGCLAIVAWVRWRRGAVRVHPGVTAPELRTTEED